MERRQQRVGKRAHAIGGAARGTGTGSLGPAAGVDRQSSLYDFVARPQTNCLRGLTLAVCRGERDESLHGRRSIG